MDISQFISHYGYIAVLLGCMLEGETAAILGGIAANKGLSLTNIYLMAFTGAWLCDSILFLIGHYYGPNILKRLHKYQHRIDKIQYLINKHDALAIIGLRFLYGLRTIGPLTIGITGVNQMRFIFFNAVGSFIWSAIFVTIGYSVGIVFEEEIRSLGNKLFPIIMGAIFIFICIVVIRAIISRTTNRKNKQ